MSSNCRKESRPPVFSFPTFTKERATLKSNMYTVHNPGRRFSYIASKQKTNSLMQLNYAAAMPCTSSPTLIDIERCYPNETKSGSG